jgi:streptogramin lyase
MPGLGKFWLLSLTTLAAGLLAAQDPADTPAGPPAMRIAFDRVKPEATFEIMAVTSIGQTSGAVWAVGRAPAAVTRIDPDANAAGPGTPLPSAPCGNGAAGFGALWIPLCDGPALARLDEKTSEVTTTPLAGLTSAAGSGSISVATGIGSVWLLAADSGILLRVDPDSRLPVADIHLPKGASDLAFGLEALWAAGGANRALRIDPHTNLVLISIAAGTSTTRVTVGEDAVWLLSEADGKVIRIDPEKNAVAATIDVADSLTGGMLAAGAGSVWISSTSLPLARIDPRTNRVVQVFTGERGASAMAIGHDSLWLAAPAHVWRVDPKFLAALRPE